MTLLTRKEAIATIGGAAGKQAVNKMDRARPTPTGNLLGENFEYCATGNIYDFEKAPRELSVFYAIPKADLPQNGVFKVRPPRLTPIGYKVK